MQKILLYYIFRPLSDPQAIRLWQKALCERLGLRGRILISEHGINGTVGGDLAALKAYVKETKSYEPFSKISFKWSEGGAEHFPRLSVKVREEIVAFDAPNELVVDENGVVGGGVHLSPEKVNELVARRDDVVFFDGRNAYEAEVGRFQNAVVPEVEHTRDFIAELESGKYDDLKDKPIISYCTGGIRCEVLSVLMKNRGFKEVYQIDGGIVRYGEAFGDSGLWEGELYVFDKRMTVPFSPEAKTIGQCVITGEPTSHFENIDRLPGPILQKLGLRADQDGQVLIRPEVLAEHTATL